MSTVGNTATPAQGYYYDSGVASCRGSRFTMPSPGGFISTLHAYFDAYNSSATGYVCLWNSSGTLLASASVGTVPTAGASIGGQAWHQATLSSPVYVASGATIYIGFSLPQSAGAVWTWENAGGNVYYANSGSPGSLSTSATYSTTGPLGAYGDYTAGSIYASDGTTEQAGVLIYASNGSAWQQCAVYCSDGSAWQQVA